MDSHSLNLMHFFEICSEGELCCIAPLSSLFCSAARTSEKGAGHGAAVGVERVATEGRKEGNWRSTEIQPYSGLLCTPKEVQYF